MIKVVHPRVQEHDSLSLICLNLCYIITCSGVLEIRHRYLKVAALNISLGIGLQKTKMTPTACFREKQSGTGDVD